MNLLEQTNPTGAPVDLETNPIEGESLSIEEIAKREMQMCGCICYYPAD